MKNNKNNDGILDDVEYAVKIKETPLKKEISAALKCVVSLMREAATDIEENGLRIAVQTKFGLSEEKNPAVDVFFRALDEIKSINDKYSITIDDENKENEKEELDELKAHYKKMAESASKKEETDETQQVAEC